MRPDGKIDEAAGRAWIAANIDPDRRRGGGATTGPAPPGSGLGTIATLRGHKLQREALRLDLELKRRNGELIDKGEVERAGVL